MDLCDAPKESKLMGKYQRQDERDPESGTVQLTTTTDSVEHWPENGHSSTGKARSTEHQGPGKEVDFAKVSMEEALSILKVSQCHALTSTHVCW